MKTAIRKEDLPKISAAIHEAMQEVGDTDEIYQDLLEEKGLAPATAEAVMAVITGIDEMCPSLARVMREIGDLATE